MAHATVFFAFEKSTKGSHRFKEVDSDNKPLDYTELAIGTLYIKKSFFGDTAPKSITIEVTTQS